MGKMTTIKQNWESFKLVRNTNLNLIKTVSPTMIDLIPSGFKNNIRWQTGHLVAVQLSLLFQWTNFDLPLDDSYLSYFGKGTSPANFDSNTPDIRRIMKDAEFHTFTTEQSFESLTDRVYPTKITVSTGHEISSFSDAVGFLPLHEAYHFASIKALMNSLKVLQKVE